MKKLLMCAVIFTAGCCLSTTEAQGPATIKEVKRSMTTYPFSEPNPIARAESSIYPYFRFDGYAEKPIQKEWKIVEMENDYIKLDIFPEIGGKMWGAIEKSTGREFIYYNHVVKFRDIAMRGAWVSGGIEFNFGIIGHVPSSATPVDYITRTKDDGSVSCFVGGTELITRTSWVVEINLPKDKAYFTTRTIWSNNSSIEQPYYQWMNAAYKSEGNVEFCYPGQYYIGHGGEVHSFPIDEEGRNIAWYNNHDFAGDKSYHVMGKYNDYYGAYHHDFDFGSVHYAPYDEKLGMKIFLWAQARSGAIWEDLLTDNDGQYIELQSGRMYNQPSSNSMETPFKHFSFTPGLTDEFKEYWFPAIGTAGISKVSPIGTLNAVRKDGKLTVAFSPLQQINAPLVIKTKNQTLFTENISLDVLQSWKKEYPLAGNTAPLTIEIGNKELVWNEAPECENMNRPNTLPKDFDWNDAYGLYVTGEQWLNQKNLKKAEEYLLKSLAKNKYFIPALNKMATVCYRTARYDKALEYIKTALSLDAYDSEANYLYGLINYDRNQADAKDGFSVASFSADYRSAAFGKLAKCYLKDRNYEKAIHYAMRAMESNLRNGDAMLVYLAATRLSGDKSSGSFLIQNILQDNPLNHPIRYEEALLNNNMNGFTELIRSEFPYQTYLDLAEWYIETGLFDEASQLLSFAGNETIPAYWAAYVAHLKGNESEAKQLAAQANSLSSELVFPFRPTSLKVFTWAQAAAPSWQTDYYTALLYWHFGDKAKAEALLDKHNDAQFAPYYMTRSQLKKGQAQLDDLLKAEKTDPTWRVGLALINYYLDSGDNAMGLQTAKRYATKYRGNYMIDLKYAKALNLNGKYKESIALLKRTNVLPNEGAYEGRAVYREAHIKLAVDDLKRKRYAGTIRAIEDSKEWIENLGVGKPYPEDIDNRLEDFITATVYEKQNKETEAKSFYQKIVDKGVSKRKSISNELLVALALQKTGQNAKADELAKSWMKNDASSKVAQWATAVYNGDNAKVASLMQERYAVEDTTPWESSSGDKSFNLISSVLQAIN